ncbi:MAG: DUF6519 domain-containing protein [Thermomicrobiales bacterium]
MHGDFSRLTFAREKHYSAVLSQQGRVLLDADANEQAAILLHYLRTLATDLIGPAAGPRDQAGFGITVAAPPNQLPDLTIGAGRYYVAGLLCENEALDEQGQPGDVRYYRQPDAFFDRENADDRLPDPPFLVYLKVWERHITALEDPAIREVALGENGPDTATRTKIVWQVLAADHVPGAARLAAGVTKAEVLQQWAAWEQARRGTDRGLLKARGRQPDALDVSPCITDPSASFRGAENQLYRVEIHTGGAAGTATFKWSRDNGAVTFPIDIFAGDEVTLLSLGRDSRLTLEAGDWVEIVDDATVLRGAPAPLQRVNDVDPLDRRVTLAGPVATTAGHNSALHPFLRRWDQQQGAVRRGDLALGPDNALTIVETTTGADGWLDLEDGVQLQFQPGGNYRSGDYWLIPARTSTGDVEWPGSAAQPFARPPAGIAYAYAPLALVTGLGPDETDDLRNQFDHLPYL